MNALRMPMPGLYAEREATAHDDAPAWAHWWRTRRLLARSVLDTQADFVRRVRGVTGPVDARQVAGLLRGGRVGDEQLARAFAAVCRAFADTLGASPYDLQIAAARALLEGRLVEMATGEGKTLAAALAACVAALAGSPVHLLTANDYLVERDAAWLRPACLALGLDLGFVTARSTPDERRAAYGQRIVYATAKELVFDYLRDRLAMGRRRTDLQLRVSRLAGDAADTSPTMRGLYLAIVDEADSILLDEARTPLVLARPGEPPDVGDAATALHVARGLLQQRHVALDLGTARAVLTPEGTQATDAQRPAGLDGRLWRERVEVALAAIHLYRRDRDYVLADGRVQIVDPATGRVAEGRAWSRGLHQMIEAKEGVAQTREQHTIARLTYQRFFPRYHRLCGLSGTLAESARELALDYRLPMQRVPERTPSRRQVAPPRLHRRRSEKWRAVLAEVERVHACGRPVLIGTASVAESELVAAMLGRRGLPHVVLNARHDHDEAGLVAAAGHAGRITVATNMAGRGTDIVLDGLSRRLGGLHVIATHVNDSPRIDRQLWGRCARQGDPGSVSVQAALDDPLFARTLPLWLRALAGGGRPGLLPRSIARALIRLAQSRAEAQARRARRDLREHDRTMDKSLSFGVVRE